MMWMIRDNSVDNYAFKPLSLAFDDIQLQADTLGAGPCQRALMLLHGAGGAHRGVYADLRHYLAGQGISSSALDFVGHGETGGSLLGSSLASRVAQAARLAEAHPPQALLGSSMGAYIAIRLLAQLPAVTHLVLQVPGVYNPAAFETPFGPEFSAILRQENSWRDSDAWDRLARFEGHLLIVAAERDEVIPHEIVERLYAAAGATCSRALLTIDHAGHQLGRHWAENPLAMTEYRQNLAAFLARD